MEKIQNVQLEFCGQKLGLKTKGDEEFVNEAVELAKLKLADATARGKGAAPHQLALIALFDLAEDYVRAKRRTQKHKEQLNEKCAKVLDLVRA